MISGSLGNKLQAIASAGFNSVAMHNPELTAFPGEPSEIAKQAGELGLKIGVLEPFSNFEGLAGSARQDAFNRLELKLDLMEQLDANMLLVTTNIREDASGDPAVWDDDYAELAERIATRNKRVALLALPWACHIKTEIQALELLERLNSPNLGLALNSSFSLSDGSLPAKLRALPCERIFHVQLADAQHKKLDPITLKIAPGLLPGQGALNLNGFVKMLARLGYSGDWTIAFTNNSNPMDSSGNVMDAYRSLIALLDEVAKTEPALKPPVHKLPPPIYPSGFEFLEFVANEDSGRELQQILQAMSFRMERKHISKSVELWRQGAINIVINTDPNGYAAQTLREHGPSVCDMGLRVNDADQTIARANALGTPGFSQPVGVGELDIPAIKSVGGSVVHFIDEKSDLHRMWDIDFNPVSRTAATPPAGLRRIDHVSQTMKYQEMQSWLTYYTTTFNLKKAPVFDLADPSGIVRSQALVSPDGEVRMILNGASDDVTFAGTFLAEHSGAGVQHIAFLTDDIFETSDCLAEAGFKRLEISSNYFDDLQARYGLDETLITRLRVGNILYDRDGTGEFFQVYGQPFFKGLFFEIVERRGGYQGYGAANARVRLAAQTRLRDTAQQRAT